MMKPNAKSCFGYKRQFSLIELITVILVVLLLLSLLIPTFVNVKMNARAALCKNQMRQIGVLFNSYSSDNGGYLPNDRALDINGIAVNTANKLLTTENNLLYEGWSGHLLPLLDFSGLTFSKRVFWRFGVKSEINILKDAGTAWVPAKTSDEAVSLDVIKKMVAGTQVTTFRGKSDGGWNIVNDAMEKGGYNELKAFICPEVFCSAYDVGISIKYNNLRIPRISQMSYDPNASFSMQPGVPTTYLASDLFFGCEDVDRRDLEIEKINSLRIDQISNVSQKVFLLEGGITQSKNGNTGSYFSNVDEHLTTGGNSLSSVHCDLTTPSNGFLTTNTDYHKLGFVHDNDFDDFWFYKDVNASFEIANKFNIAFKGKAEMIAYSTNYEGASFQGTNWRYCIFTRIDPFIKPFDAFFLTNPRPSGTTGISGSPILFDDSAAFHYLTGKMNVLFGDGSVASKDRSWLSMNKRLIRTP